MSQSEQFRKEGNGWYAHSKEEGIGSSVQKYRLESAQRSYTKAFNATTTDHEKASAAKNLFIMSQALCELYGGKDILLLTYHFRDAKINQEQALTFGKRVMTEEWKDTIALRFQELFEYIADTIRENMSVRHRYQPYHKMIVDIAGLYLGAPEVQAKLYLMLLTKYFHFSVEVSEEGEYSKALGFLHDCYTPMELGRSCLSKICQPDAQLTTEFNVKQEEIKMQMAIFHGRLTIDKGDGMQKRLLFDDEDLNMDLAWDTADVFREAIQHTKDPESQQSFDIEIEAMAFSRLGVLYDKVMSNVSMTLAKPCFRTAVDLALTLRPRDVTKTDWYKIAQQTLLKYQELIDRNDVDAETARKKKILEGMKEEKEKLDKIKNKDRITLLVEVYKLFPLKSGKKTEFSDADVAKFQKKPSDLKAALKKAVTDYHPDRNKKYGEEWTVLCEELCKILTGHYESMKFAD